MKHFVTAATVFAAATLLASGAYAGSPYYDANGQTAAVAAPKAHTRAPAARPSYDAGTTPVASVPNGAAAAGAPSMASDGFEKPEADSAFYEHAEGTMGSPVASDGPAAAPKAQPTYTAAMPKMDADGFLPREGDRSLYEHAAGNMGTP